MTIWQCIWYILRWPFQRRPRHVLAWIAVGLVCCHYLFICLQMKVDGHITCDFGGQWMQGRAFFLQQCDQLYLADAGKEWLGQGYTSPKLEELIESILRKGQKQIREDGIEGPLYPPTAAILFSVFAAFPPITAHALADYTYLLMTCLCGWMISRITHGNLQAGEATLIILLFPNNFMGLMLGQNQILTLTIITAGWFCYSRGWRFVGGLIWGLLAYKPVFAVALLLVPLALPSLRLLVGMGAGGLAFVVLTLPFTHGLAPWQRWFEVGQNAEQIYRIDRNWVWMSRDLVGLPRRKTWDVESFIPQLRHNIGVWRPGARWGYTTEKGDYVFSPALWLFWTDEFDEATHQQVYVEKDDQGKDRSPWWATTIGWTLLGIVAMLTVLLGWLTAQRGRISSDSLVESSASRSAFLLTGALLCVYHFMHYDVVTFSLPALLALACWPQWSKFRRVFLVVWFFLIGCCSYNYQFGNGILNWPWDTFLMIILWGWLGWTAWSYWRSAQANQKEKMDLVP